MSTVIELREQAMTQARKVKETHVAQARGTEPWATDLPALVQGFRGGEPVVRLMPELIQRDPMLNAVDLAARFYDVDVVATTMETWGATGEHVRINPVTGRRWAQYEMQDVAENHDGVARGWLTACLVTMVVDRAGEFTTGIQDYRITRSDSALGVTSYAIEWAGRRTDDEGRVTGLLRDRLVAAMNAPSMDSVARDLGVTPAAFDLSETAGRAHADAAATRIILRTGVFGGALVLYAGDAERAEILEESLGHLPERWGIDRPS